MGAHAGTSATVGGGEHALEELLLFAARALADHPEEVEVQFISDEEGDVFEIRANEADLGRLIGRNGQTAKALQTILNANARRSGRRYHLDIVGPEDELDEE